jgi:hypothetical protein
VEHATDYVALHSSSFHTPIIVNWKTKVNSIFCFSFGVVSCTDTLSTLSLASPQHLQDCASAPGWVPSLVQHLYRNHNT